MGGDHGRQLGRLDPVEPLDRRVRPGQPAGLRPVLAGADHQRPHLRGVGEQAERPADRRRPLQRGEQPEERHPQHAGSVRGPAADPASNQAAGAPTGTTSARSASSAGHQLGVLGAVEQDQVGAAQRAPVERPSSAHRPPRWTAAGRPRCRRRRSGGRARSWPAGTAAGRAARRSGRGSRRARRPAPAAGTPRRPRTASSSQQRASRNAPARQPPRLAQHRAPGWRCRARAGCSPRRRRRRWRAGPRSARPCGDATGRRTSRTPAPSRGPTLPGAGQRPAGAVTRPGPAGRPRRCGPRRPPR